MPTKNDDDPAVKRARRLGIGFDLALKLGIVDLHVSLVYFNNVRSDYEKGFVKQLAEDYFTANNLTAVDLELGGPCFDRSVEVKGQLVQIAKDLEDMFTKQTNFSVNPNPLLHVDLRNCPKAAQLQLQTKGVPLFDNWLHCRV